MKKTRLIPEVDDELLDNPEKNRNKEMDHYKSAEKMKKMFQTEGKY